MTTTRQPGEACVKQEYIIIRNIPSEGTHLTSVNTKKEENIHLTESNGVQTAEKTSVVEKPADKNDSLDESNYEPVKKKKKKGQNKRRARTVPKDRFDSKICPALLRDEVCNFNEKCKFLHDIGTYMKNKPTDIGPICVNYTLKGKCRYSVECRFGKEHLTDDHKNIIDHEKFKLYSEGMDAVQDNTLKQNLMVSLRKKQYKFPKTEKYLKSLNGNNTETSIPQIMKEEIGLVTDEDLIKPTIREKKKVDFKDKLYLAPLTTVGNLPFRRICKRLGADITCGEMALSTNLLQGQKAEWALVKRHPSEDVFGVQICGGFPDTMTKVTEMLNNECDIDFIDINMGCPIDLVFKRGEGSALMGRMNKLKTVVKGMVEVSDVPITIKMRTGIYENKSIAHKVIPLIKEWGVDLMTLHGRSKEQRYTKAADWNYIHECSQLSDPVPFFGNGDILSYEDVMERREATCVSGVMIARGALIKPWLFTEIKEQRHWDITSQERFDLLKDFTNYGLEHWGSDNKGVENTRRFLLEWLSFLNRYIPVGLLEVVPQKINERPPSFFGRNDLETLFASKNCEDWVKISEMLLGPVPDNFNFLPKHKANSYN